MFIFVFLLIAVLIWMAVTYRARQKVKNCRWRENRRLDDTRGRYFLCVHCGAETHCADLKPPRHCLRPVDAAEE